MSELVAETLSLEAAPVGATVIPNPAGGTSGADTLGLFSRLKALQRQLEFLNVQVSLTFAFVQQ